MARIILSRIFQGLLTLFVLVTITFFLVRMMPGSPYTDEKALPKHILEQLQSQMGLNEPLPVQYGIYFKNLIAHQELGPLIRKDGVYVGEIIAESFPVSALLGLMSIGIALIVGIPAGIIAAVKKNGPLDYACLAAAMTGSSRSSPGSVSSPSTSPAGTRPPTGSCPPSPSAWSTPPTSPA
jgi:oligopeptide transport system permease protein